MADRRLIRIQPIRVTLEPIVAEAKNRDGAEKRQPKKRSIRERLVAARAPGRAPASCEVDSVMGAQGTVAAVLFRDVSNRDVIARIKTEDLAARKRRCCRQITPRAKG